MFANVIFMLTTRIYNPQYKSMKRSFLVLFIALSFVTCNKDETEEQVLPKEEPKPASWKQLNDYPGEARTSGISFSLLGKGYWGLGNNMTTNFLREIWSYDPEADSWEKKNDFPFDLPAEIALTNNNKAYVMTYSGSVYEYDPIGDTWKYLTSFPTANRPGITGFSLGEHLYFGTGNNVDLNNFTVFKDFWKYDPIENRWTSIPDFPGTARTEAVSFVVGENAYVGLGYNGRGAPPIYKDIWNYNPITNKWSQIKDFPEGNSLVGILFSNSTKGYIGLSEIDHGRMFEYDPINNSWQETQKFPDGRSLLTNSFILNERIFVFGGWGPNYSKQVWEFIP